MGILATVLSGYCVALVAPWLPRLAGRWIGWLIALVPLSITIYLFSLTSGVSDGTPVRSVYSWVPGLDISLSFSVDGLGLIFGLLISGIGTLIMFYAGAYLGDHPHVGRFYATILIFMASMLGLVLADNIITFFVFWELTSISSYILIGFDFEKAEARYAARQALLVTGLGGQALLAGLILMAIAGGSWEFTELMNNADALHSSALYVPMVLLILLGAFTKSAQVPFHFWLPGAMAAPTPVSAYLHSATMVKAGIYLIARTSPGLGGSDLWYYMLTIAGAATMFLGAYLAMQRTDLKQILAYTTVSGLGTLVMLLGLGTELAVEAAMVFLVVHSLYKGALFLVAGTVDHETGTRDVRLLSGLRRAMPITALAAAVAALSMSGIPPLLGFIGKELIYEAALDAETFSVVLVIVAVAANVLTIVAAGIVGFHPFFGKEGDTPKHPHEAPAAFWLGPLLLGILGLSIGILPAFFDVRILSPAVSAILGEDVSLHLALWHGINTMLILSIITVAIGVVLFLNRELVHKAAVMTMGLGRYGPLKGYDFALAGLDWIAQTQTRLLQNGYLRYYLATIMVVMTVVVGFTIFYFDQFRLPAISIPDDVLFLEVAVVGLIIAAAITAALSQSRMAAVVSLGVVGYGVATVYILFGAPDLAMTQILVETLTVILFVLVLIKMPRFLRLSTIRERVRDGVIAISAGALMTVLMLIAINTRFADSISHYHAQQSYPAAHGRNIVNVILVDFRAMDTLGEIVVLAVAGIGVYALLRLRLPEGGESK